LSYSGQIYPKGKADPSNQRPDNWSYTVFGFADERWRPGGPRAVSLFNSYTLYFSVTDCEALQEVQHCIWCYATCIMQLTMTGEWMYTWMAAAIRCAR